MAPEKSAKKVVKKFAEETSTHAIRYIVLAKSKVVRLIWLVLFLTASGFFIYELQKLLKAYCKRPTLVSVEKKAVKELNFPSVTICKASTLSKSGGVQEHPFIRDPAKRDYYLRQNDITTLRAQLALEYNRYFTFKDLKEAAGDPDKLFLTDLPGGCIFGLHQHCHYPANISRVITSSYGGLCYQFNKNGMIKQRDAGSYYGLKMLLFVNQSDFVPFTTFDFGSGILLNIHDSGEYPFPEINGLPISPGFLTRISIKKSVYKRLKDPYPTNCTDGKGIDMLYPGSYTIANCKRSCLVRDSLKACGSSDPLTMMLLDRAGKYKYKLINDTTQQCIFESAARSTSADREACLCPVPCREIEYTPTISQTKWPSQADLPLYKLIFSRTLGVPISTLTDDFVHNNFLQLNIFFDEMSFQDISEKKEWTLEKLISDIGGQIGVWIGASVLSLCEVAFFVVKLVRALHAKRTKPAKETVSMDGIAENMK